MVYNHYIIDIILKIKGNKKMNITFIRHGQTNANKNKIICGHSDIDLNETGIMQIKQVRDFLFNHHLTYDLIGSSSLKRAQQSLKIINEKLNIKTIIIDDHFIERDFGSFDGLDIDTYAPICMQEGFKQSGFEDTDTLIKRVKKGLKYLYTKYPKANILFITHNHVIRSLTIISGDAKNFNITENNLIKNSAIYQFSYTNKLKLLSIKELN